MKKILTLSIIFASTSMTLTSCNWAKEKTKTAISKTGEVVGKTGSEFGNGVYNGIKKSFENDIEISEDLKKAGFQIGEVTINSTDSTSDNVLTVYAIFNQKFDKNIRIKVYNEEGKEYGRTSENIKGEKGDAEYIDFNFGTRVKIGAKGNIKIEQIE
ncbi:hypothetical protein ACFSX9_10980 [Flavobacterium ardleyense]|uniref:Lipoprotein n=1 Tax=Flavobacterium ardleyense TaxID=2038737 RepID=A0ABW5Z9S4_9FLAO